MLLAALDFKAGERIDIDIVSPSISIEQPLIDGIEPIRRLLCPINSIRNQRGPFGVIGPKNNVKI